MTKETKVLDFSSYVNTDFFCALSFSLDNIWFSDYIEDKVTLRFKDDNLLIEVIVLVLAVKQIEPKTDNFFEPPYKIV